MGIKNIHGKIARARSAEQRALWEMARHIHKLERRISKLAGKVKHLRPIRKKKAKKSSVAKPKKKSVAKCKVKFCVRLGPHKRHYRMKPQTSKAALKKSRNGAPKPNSTPLVTLVSRES